MSKRIDKRKQSIRRVIREEQRAKGDGLLPTVIRTVLVALGRVVIDLPLPNRLTGVAYSIGLAAAGHTALRIASAAPHWSGDLQIMKQLDSIADEVCDRALAEVFGIVAQDLHWVAREFLARPASFLPLRAEDLSWCEPPEMDEPAFQPEGTLEMFDRRDLKGTEVGIVDEVIPLLAKGLAPRTETPSIDALVEYTVSANAIGKIALSRWSRTDARFLNYLACLTSKDFCPDAEKLRGVR